MQGSLQDGGWTSSLENPPVTRKPGSMCSQQLITEQNLNTQPSLSESCLCPSTSSDCTHTHRMHLQGASDNTFLWLTELFLHPAVCHIKIQGLAT